MNPDREKLLAWKVEDDAAPQSPSMGQWFKGSTLNWLPTKAEMRQSGLEQVLHGWTPPQPLITPQTRVLALGSCFARYFVLWLGDHGFNQNFPDSPYNALLRNSFGFESPAAIAQQFRWAFGELDSSKPLWIDQNKEQVEATEEGRILVRETLQKTDVLVLTLGLSEVWFDKLTGEPLWRAVPVKLYDPARHLFKIEKFCDTLAALEVIDRIRTNSLPNLKILFTVSPIRLKATFRPVSALSANSVSKSILRAAVDEFLRGHEDQLNRTYFYFPSYEIVTDVLETPFRDDNRHLYNHVPEVLMTLFARHYTSYQAPSENVGEQFVTESTYREFHKVIAQLEAKNLELQAACDQRQSVIEELDREAKRRLEIIEQLESEKRQTLRLFKNRRRKDQADDGSG
ncbi:MAG: GSCFA domain-containing protein [Acidobacteriota bacterium]